MPLNNSPQFSEIVTLKPVSLSPDNQDSSLKVADLSLPLNHASYDV
jgi:hypothetical protein